MNGDTENNLVEDNDYWRFGLYERAILLTILITQWALVMNVVGLVVQEHASDSYTSEFVSLLSIGSNVGLAAMSLALIGYPIIRAGPDIYRAVKSKVKS